MTSEEKIEETAEEVAQNEIDGKSLSEPPEGSGEDESAGGFGLSRGNILLLAALVLQAGLAAYMLWPSSTTGEAGVPLLGEIDASAVTGLTITEGDEEIGFEQAGGDWAIAGTGGFVTNNDSDGVNKVVALLDKLLAIDGNRLVTKTPSSHKRLQVAEDDFVRKATITTANGEQTLYIGSSAGSGATHVRLDGSDEAFLTDQVSSFELNTGASSWIDTQYFSLEANDITAFTLENANGTFAFERGESEAEGTPGPWLLAELADGESLDQTKVNTLVNQATNIRMTEPVGTAADAEFALGGDEGATVTFTVQESGEGANPDPQTITLLVGGASEDGTEYYAKASDSDYVVLVSQYNGNQLLDKVKADFLAEPEEADAGEGTTAEAGGGTEPESIFALPGITETLSLTETGATFNVTEGITETNPVTITESITE